MDGFRRYHPQRASGTALTGLATTSLILLGVLALAPESRAATIPNFTLDVTGGAGLDVGNLCPTTDTLACSPATMPNLALQGSGSAVSGVFAYNTSAQDMSFSLTLTQNATFGTGDNAETLLAGSTFSATAVPVTQSAKGTALSQTSALVTGTANLHLASGLGTLQESPTISGLSCTFGTKFDTCGVDVGAPGLEVGPSGSGVDYNAAVAFNVTATPVPLPASAWLLLFGMGGLAGLRRRQR